MSKKSNGEKEVGKKENEKEEIKSKKDNSQKDIKKQKEVLGYIEDFKFNIQITKSSKNKLKLTLSSKDSNDNFEGEFSLKDLINENKVFAVFEDIDDVIDNLKLVIANEYLSLFLDMNYEFYFEFFIDINGKKKQVRLMLQPTNEDSRKKMAIRIKEQQKKIEELTKKNEKIEKNYQYLYNTIKRNYEISPQYVTNNQVCFEAKSKNNLSIDSKVFKNEDEISFIKKCISNKIYKDLNQNFTFKLLYRATRDGDKATTFHKFCDGICPLLVLVKTKKEIRFGGFTDTYFESTKEYKGKRDDKAFIFSLDKLKSYNIEKGQNAILCFKNYGPVFYGNRYSNIFLSDDFFKTEGTVAKKGDRFHTQEDFEINMGEQSFNTKQIEVFQIKLCDE